MHAVKNTANTDIFARIARFRRNSDVA